MGWVNRVTAGIFTCGMLSLPAFGLEAEQKQELLLDAADITEELVELYQDQAAPVEALAQQLGNDPLKIIDYLRKSVAYVPYNGVLKGAAGTILSGSGNSYDQSLAAATLLSRAGYTTQVLVGTLSPAHFAGSPLLPKAMPLERNKESPDIAELTQELQSIIEQLAPGSDATVIAKQDWHALPDTYAETLEKLRKLDPALLANVQAPSLQSLADKESSQLYALVRYKRLPSDPWTMVDLARGSNVEDIDTSAFTVLSSTIPQEHLHQVSVSVEIEANDGKRSNLVTFNAPAANIGTDTLSFSVVPSSLYFQGPEGGDPFAENQSVVFTSKHFPDTMLSPSGSTIDLTLAQSQSSAASFLTTIADKAFSAGGTLKNPDSANQRGLAYDSITVVIETAVPGYDNAVDRRALYDRRWITPELQASLRTVLPDNPTQAQLERVAALYFLSSDWSMTVSNGAADRLAVKAAGFKALATLFELMAEPDIDQSASSELTDDSLQLIGQALAARITALVPDQPKNARYHVRPSIVIANAQLAEIQSRVEYFQQLRTDIVADGRLDFNGNPQPWLHAIEAAGREAYFATSHAKLFLADMPSKKFEASSYDALAGALAMGGPPLSGSAFISAIREKANTGKFALQAEYLEGVARQGRDVVVGWIGAEAESTAWLEVDSSTKLYRLVSGIGTGSTATEEMIINTIAVSAMYAMNLYKCLADYEKDSQTNKIKAQQKGKKCIACAAAKASLAVSGIFFGGLSAVGAIAGSTVFTEAVCL